MKRSNNQPNFIGNKEVFAIMYELLPYNKEKDFFFNAKSCIWINNKYIGDYNNVSPIYGLYLGLQYFYKIKSDFFQPEFLLTKSAKELFLKINPDFYEGNSFFDELENEDKVSCESYFQYNFSANEAYDAFPLDIFVLDNNYNFVWTYYKHNPEFVNGLVYPDCEPDTFHHFKIPREVFENVFEEFEKLLSSYW